MTIAAQIVRIQRIARTAIIALNFFVSLSTGFLLLLSASPSVALSPLFFEGS